MVYIYHIFFTTMEKKTKRIKILFTIPNFDTAGSGKALLKIAQSLNKNLFEAEIMCMHNKGAFFEIVKKSGLPIHIYNYHIAIKPYLKGIRECWKLSRVLKKINPDIIHSFHYSSDYSESIAAKMAGIKWIYTKKNMHWGGSSKNSWKLRSFLASHIILLNSDMKKMFFPKSNKVSVISRSVDIKEFDKRPKSKKLLNQLEIKEDTRVLITVSNLVPLKGVDILIKAFEKSKLNNGLWKLIIVGDNKTSYGKELQSLVKELFIEEKVIFTGKQLNVNEYLNLGELFIFPTINRGEGFGLALMEAMSSGLCAYGSDLPGIRDQLYKYPDYLFKPNDINVLVELLNEYSIKEISEIEKKQKEFYSFARTNFSLNIEVEKTQNVYISL